jgi:hypothetical protein
MRIEGVAVETFRPMTPFKRILLKRQCTGTGLHV